MNRSAEKATTVSLLTPPGRSAVAVVAINGPQAETSVDQFFQPANKRPLSQQPINRIAYGYWGSSAGEDLIVCRRKPNVIEVHCHGGSASIAEILDNLTSVGCQQTDWPNWLAGQGEDPLACQAQIALAKTTTLRTAKILLDQHQGALKQEITFIQQLLNDGNPEQAQCRIQALLQHTDLGQHLTQPWRVVIAGQPNVGKSSLINALVGYGRAIVFDQPGTTRDVVTAATAIEGWPVQLSDTAGLHSTDDEIERAGIALAQQQLAEADLVLWVFEAQHVSQATPSIEQLCHAQCRTAGVQIETKKVLHVVNKIDLLNTADELPPDTLAVSAQQGTGLDDLLATIARVLIPNPPAPGSAVPFTSHHVEVLNQAMQYCQQSQLQNANQLLAQLLSQPK